MIIRELQAHLVYVDIDKNDWATLHDTGKYLRLKSDAWWYLDRKDYIGTQVFNYKVEELEKEFQETINVMHEQLELI